MPVNDSLKQLLDADFETKPLKEVVEASTSALQGISEAKAEQIASALGAKTIADLATNKYVLAAQALVALAKFEK